MSRATDRILDLALAQVLGGEVAPDLRENVLASIRQGPGSGRGRRWRRGALAAAAALLVLAIPAWLLLRETVPSPAAVSDSRLTILSAEGVERTGDRIEAGETAVFAQPARLRLFSGAELAAEAGSRVKLTAPDGVARVRFLSGRIRALTRSPEPLLVATAGGLFRVAPESELEVSETPVLNAVLSAGSAAIVHAGRELVVPAGRFVGLSPDIEPTIVPLPEDAQRRRIDGLLTDALVSLADLDPRDPAVLELDKRRATAMGALRGAVADGDPAGGYAIAILAHLPCDPSRPGVRRNVLELLLRDPGMRGAAAVRRSLEREPAAFGSNELVAAVEADVPGAAALLAARFEEGARGLDRRLVAALFALRGDGRGRVELETAVARLNPILMNLRLLAAAALHRLGETSFWTDELRRLGGEVEGALERGDLAYARTVVLRIAYFHRGLAGEPVRVSWLMDRIGRFRTRREADLETADEIRAVLRSMTR